MARTRGGTDSAVEASVGYAADERGNGLAYARLTGPRSRRLLRVGFRIGKRAPCERAIGYAALTAIVRALSKRGLRSLRFVLGDADFANEVTTGNGVSERLALAYVGLRCSLNSLAAFSVQAGSTDELTQRARAEVALNLAA
ncbi:MAG TPA: hypothetical protein VMU38_00940 [Candidatus Binatia bacterium]|nr:hypothetical protein [Candidatus Binatia bacterium]